MSEEKNDPAVKYPNCVVQLTGVDGNAVAIFRTVRKGLIRYLVEQEWSREDATKEGDAYQDDATSGDYKHVLIASHRWVKVV